MARSFKRPDEAAMQRVFARTSGGAAEVVLRLAWLQGLHRAEITALRWDQVDFAGRALLLPDRTIPLDPSAEACLRAWYVRCAATLSSARSKPMAGHTPRRSAAWQRRLCGKNSCPGSGPPTPCRKRPRWAGTSGNTSSGASSSRRAAPRRGWRCGWAGSCGCSPARSPD